MPLPRLGRRSRLRAVSAVTIATVIALPATALAEPRAHHRIERGETLSEIARSYGVTTSELAEANGLSNSDRIYFGRTLKVPSDSAASTGTHTVARGETLSEIAVRYGVPARELAAANNLSDPYRILAGGQLKLPGVTGAPASDEPEETVLHTVTRGQTLSGIAARYRVPSAAIATANGLRSRNHIVEGTQLRIPVTGRPGSAVVNRDTVERLIEQKAEKYGWDPNLIKALAWQESGWNNGVVSSAGAVGIMQVLPGTNRQISEKRAGRKLDLHDPADNVEAGILYLELMYELTDGDSEKILAGYYQGLRSVRQNGRYASTDRYIANVLALWDRFESTG